MKRLFAVTGLLLLCFSAFGLTLETGDKTIYFPVGAPQVTNQSRNSYSNCFVSKIAKAPGYSDGVYELQLTSFDWLGTTVVPVTFTYILKANDDVYLIGCFLGMSEKKHFKVASISDNRLVLNDQTPPKASTKPKTMTDEERIRAQNQALMDDEG